jgi:hypothetical protein
MSRKQQLMSRLPRLPDRVERRLSDSTIAGLKALRAGGGFALTGDPHQLSEPMKRYHWFKGPHWVQGPDPDIDLMTTNSARRKLIVFGERNENFRRSVNVDLSGGESYPLLTTALGVGVGFISGGAGLAWTGLTTAISLSRDNQPVRVRNGDEVHQVEIVGVSGGKIMHLEWLILIDPFRVRANREIKQWIIHDQRNEIHLD